MADVIDEVLDDATLEQLEPNYTSKPPTTSAELTRPKVIKALKALKEGVDRYGFIKLARGLKLTPAQLKLIKRKWLAKIRELQLIKNPPEEPAPTLDKDTFTAESAQACYVAYREIEARGGSISEIFTKYGFSMGVFNSTKAEVKRIMSDLRSMPSADVTSDYLDVATIQSDFNIPEYVQAPEVEVPEKELKGKVI